MSETFEAHDMVTLSFSNDIKASYGDLIVNCYIYAGKRVDELPTPTPLQAQGRTPNL